MAVVVAVVEVPVVEVADVVVDVIFSRVVSHAAGDEPMAAIVLS